MTDFSAAQWALFVFAVALAFGVRGSAGFGGGVVAVPMLALIAPLQVVVPLTSALNTAMSLSQGFRDWKKVEWREMARLLPFALVGVITGIFFLANIDAQPLSRAFGLFVVAYALYMLAAKGKTPAIPRRLLTPVAVVLSFAGGLIGSVFGGAAGPVFVIYLNSLQVEKDRFRATMTMLMLTLGTTRVIGFVVAAMYTQRVLMLLLVAVPLAYAGGRLGHYLVRRIEQRVFNAFIGIVLLASGVILMLK